MNVYNGERFVESTINGILEQTFDDFEFIIIDDGSTDATPAILHAAAHKDPRIRMISHTKNEGIYVSANEGIRAARGRYIARTDHDDLSFPDRLRQQAQFLDMQPDSVLVTSNWFWVQGERLTPSLVPSSPGLAAWFLHFYNHVSCQSAVMFRTDAVLSIGGYNEQYRFAADYDLWTRMSAIGQIGILSAHHVWCRRELPSSITLQHRSEQKRIATEISLRMLEELTDRRFDDQLPADMAGFWPLYWKKPFPPATRAAYMHEALQQAYRAFIQQWGSKEHGMDARIRHATANAFTAWTEHLLATDQRKEAQTVEKYAKEWKKASVSV